jgi:hypothetical protein
VSPLPLGRVPTLALVNAIALIAGSAIRADDIAAPATPPQLLFSSGVRISSPLEEDIYTPGFGVRKGVGVQLVKPVEINDHKYELKLAGPFLKSATKQKSVGLKFELRF